MDYRCIIWDWNGTLADDLDASLRAANDILSRHGKPPITLAQYYSYMDSPISRFYEHLFDLSHVPMSLIGQEFSAFYPKYFEGLHPGAEELLQLLRKAGIKQVILSSSHRENIERDIRRLGIRQYFDEILAQNDLLAESKAEIGLHWVKSQSIPPSQMVMVGDTLHDYDASVVMGTDCILCAIGHQAEADLRRAGVPVLTAFSQLRVRLLPSQK